MAEFLRTLDWMSRKMYLSKLLQVPSRIKLAMDVLELLGPDEALDGRNQGCQCLARCAIPLRDKERSTKKQMKITEFFKKVMKPSGKSKEIPKRQLTLHAFVKKS